MGRCDPFGFPKPQEKSSHDQDPCGRGRSLARPRRICHGARTRCCAGRSDGRANAPSSSSPSSITIIITITTWLRKLLPLRLPRNNLELRRDLFVSEFALNSKLSAQSFVRRAFLSSVKPEN